MMRIVLTALLLAASAAAAAPIPAAPSAAAPEAATPPSPGTVPGTGTVRYADGGEPREPGVRRLIESYVGLYRADRLAEWKRLLHEKLSVADPGPDGAVRFRGLEEFFGRQQGFFATGRRIGERLEAVRVEEGRRIARVSGEFVFVDEGEERRGRLGLHLAEEKGEWRVVAILFAYDKG